ncbi:MAG: sodium:calcium antiporter [Gammaproteobacteria bacterium]|jgi:cation:H+ antiporter
MLAFGELLISLVVILIAAETFTNALEHLGEDLGISEGVTGSIFAAVGTALPETMVPLLAIFAGTANTQLNEEIGVGAILGAPLMLSTLSLFLMGASVVRSRGWNGELHPERTGLLRDINFFLLAFFFAAVALFIPKGGEPIRVALASLLILGYFVYLLMTVRASAALVADGHGTEAHHRLFASFLRLPENAPVVVLQLLVGLALLIGGAKGFIYGVEDAAEALGLPALVLSLVLIPVATELPEKVNSILWIRRRRDTLAYGNITGAMVFQGTLLPALGIMLTPWAPRPEIYSGIVITWVAMVWQRFLVRRDRLHVWHLLPHGVLYVIYLGIALGLRSH